MMRRKKAGYFEKIEGVPEPITVSIKRRVNFNEVDAMAVVWHGHYTRFFEEAAAELGRKCGFSYETYYKTRIQAPIVQLHVDYHAPVLLEEVCTVEASLIWSEGARLHTEYRVLREKGDLAAAGYTVQMYMNALTKEALLVSPEMLERCRERWRAGEYHRTDKKVLS